MPAALFVGASCILGWMSMPVLAQDALERRGLAAAVTVGTRCVVALPCLCGAIGGWLLIDNPASCVCFTLACACMGALLACDLRERILPTGFVAAMACLAVVYRGIESGLSHCIGLAFAAGCVAATLYAANRIHMHVRSYEFIGAGDIRMIMPLMLFMGFRGIPVGMLAASMIMGAIALLLLVTKQMSRNAYLPLAPGLVTCLLCGTLIPLL